ncbi:MAG: AraC family transcriptional regulator, partial [Saprospiraceae bacterium]|nr:AraC family transcriptional regulator [Saprospiraceae bacterium]
MSADPDNEYFSDGITEEIINALTTIRGLKVIARTSSFAFKNRNIDVRTIGNQLGVTMVLEGSVRKAKNRVRITAQLVSTSDGSHFWSRNFDRDLEDIFSLQDEVSLLIADQIRENFGHFEIQDHLVEAPTKNMEAYQLYLKGRYHQLK